MTVPTTGLYVPTFAELRELVADDFALSGFEARIRWTWPWALAQATAAATYGLLGAVAFLARRGIVDRADDSGVLRWGRVFKMSPTPGAVASGLMTFNGTVGIVIPAGTLIVRNSDGWEYETTEEGVVGGLGTVDIIIASRTGGAGANDALGTLPYSLASPIEGVDSVCFPFIIGPQDGTDDEPVTPDFLERVLYRLRHPPHGGAAFDYIAWAQEALSTVADVWVVKQTLTGVPATDVQKRVFVYFTLEGTGAAIVPSGGDRATVVAHLLTRAPDIALPSCPAVTGLAATFHFTSAGATAAQKAAVEAALATLCASKNGERQEDTHAVGYPTLGTVTLYNSEIRAAVGGVLSAVGYTVVDVNGGGALANVAVPVSQALYRGAVSWA